MRGQGHAVWVISYCGGWGPTLISVCACTRQGVCTFVCLEGNRGWTISVCKTETDRQRHIYLKDYSLREIDGLLLVSYETPRVMHERLQSNISWKSKPMRYRWKLTDSARDLCSKAKPNPLCFFYEALCGWEEPKNNLHNMVEKKLIPQPHLLLWLRLLIYRFMAGCVFIAASRRVCVPQREEGERWLCVAGRGANWQIMYTESCGGIPPSCVSPALQQPLQPGFIKRDTGGLNGLYLLRDKNRPHQPILYRPWQLEREQSSKHSFTLGRECSSKAHSEKRNSHKQPHLQAQTPDQLTLVTFWVQVNRD